MELGQHHLQVFSSVSLIVTAAVAAFICDVLKRNNEQLREMNIELKIRQEEARKRSQAPVAYVAEAAPAAPILPAPKERAPRSQEKKRSVNSVALAVMERGAALAGSGRSPHSASIAHVASPGIATGKKDWGSLLSRNAQGVNAAPAPIAAAPAQLSELQAGFHDGFVLNKLVQSRQPISGLVVSIGVNAPGKGDRKLPEAISKLVESLIGPNDFAAQSSHDEFLLIYPREHGASAQRRLSQIAQQLWDFQLRSLGSFQILFSWGGVEVQSETIDEAIASASERMLETKRGRKLLTMESPGAATQPGNLRQAV